MNHHCSFSKMRSLLLTSFSEMLVYSQFPALGDFCLVVCHVCNQVVTPQGILTHYGKRQTQTPLRAQSHTKTFSHNHTLHQSTHTNAPLLVSPHRGTEQTHTQLFRLIQSSFIPAGHFKTCSPCTYPPHKQTPLGHTFQYPAVKNNK